MLHFTMHVPEPALLDGFMPDITPEELEEVLNASLREDMQLSAVPEMPLVELDGIAPRTRYSRKIGTGCHGCSACSICLDEFTMRTRRYVRRLPCGHVFCSPCICKWVTTHSASCPTCRKPLYVQVGTIV